MELIEAEKSEVVNLATCALAAIVMNVAVASQAERRIQRRAESALVQAKALGITKTASTWRHCEEAIQVSLPAERAKRKQLERQLAAVNESIEARVASAARAGQRSEPVESGSFVAAATQQRSTYSYSRVMLQLQSSSQALQKSYMVLEANVDQLHRTITSGKAQREAEESSSGTTPTAPLRSSPLSPRYLALSPRDLALSPRGEAGGSTVVAPPARTFESSQSASDFFLIGRS
mmetsp:Transcript_49353/g.77113  ORF Transcript_49353/g.77113 Transcript_49353/m.77113 type:complete len:234 (+) Transcript_49353:60-761(+)